MPLLSIILPVYNSDLFVGQAINSLLKQTFRDFELLIIDDGSTDRTAAIISSFIDQRIKIIVNPVNRGIVFSRNRGLRSASGDFIAQFDADDVAMPDKFMKQIRFLQDNPDFGMVG